MGEDRKIVTYDEWVDRQGKKPSVAIARSVIQGGKSAWNMFNLKMLDANKRITENADNMYSDWNGMTPNSYEPSETGENLSKEIEEDMKTYREKELTVLREFQAFKETLNDIPTRAVSDLAYGGAKYFLDPTEILKTIALNTATGGVATTLGATGKMAKVGQVAVDILIDTIDNYHTNQWEDKLLEQDYGATTDEQWLQAFGGAVVGNSIGPLVKLGGKTIKGIGGEFANGFNSKTIDAVKETMHKIDVLDLTSSNPIKTLKNDNYFKKITEEPMPNGTFARNLKREIADKEMTLETGFTQSSVNMREFKNRIETVISKMGEQVDSMTALGKEYDLDKIQTHSDRNGQDIVKTIFTKPVEITEQKFKGEYKSRIRNLTTKYDDTLLNTTAWRKNVHEKMAEDLEEGTVATAVIDSVFTGGQTHYLAKQDAGLDPRKLTSFATKTTQEFRDAIGTGVTYITKENDKLFRTHPKYKGYFSDTMSYRDFDSTVAKACDDYVGGNITREEFKMVLFYQGQQFMAFKGTGEAKGKFVTKVNKKLTTLLDNLKDVDDAKIEDIRKVAAIENLEKKLNEVKKRKTDIALMSLAFNKKDALNFFANVKDFGERAEFLGGRIDGLKVREGETTEDALNRFIEELFTSTKSVKAVAQDVNGVYKNYGDDIHKDLVDIIRDNFEGKTTADKMEGFAYFMDLWKNDNISMLNTMESITMSTKASVVSLGVPLYQIERIVKDEGGLIDLAFNIPVLRKDFDSFVEMSKKNPKKYEQIEKSVMKALKNYVDHKSVFEKPSQPDVMDTLLDSTMYIARNFYLAFSGMKEVLAHPMLASVKASGMYKGGFTDALGYMTLDLPKVLSLGVLREIKPFMQTTVSLKKLYRGLGTLIGDDELAILELNRSFETISPVKKGTVVTEGIKGTAEMIQRGLLHFQGSMQNIRYLASRFQGIRAIKQALKEEDFDLLPQEMKNIMKTFYIKDQIAFDSWKKEVNQIGLNDALYTNGKSDITKYLHENITYDLYAEDPLKHVKPKSQNMHALTKIRTMFTTFTNDMLSYGSDSVRYYKDADGVYQSRLTPQYLEHLKNNPTEVLKEPASGVGKGLLLGTATFGGLWIDGKTWQTSKDEEVEARLSAILDNGHNRGKYITKLMADLFLEGTQASALLQSGNVLGSLVRKAKSGNLVPTRIGSVYNALQGTPVYNDHPYGMDWYETAKYKEKVKEDKEERRANIELFEKAMSIATAEVLEENGEISKEQALEIKRRDGIDDIAEAKKIQGAKHYQTILNISLAQGGMNKSDEEFINDLARNITIASENDLLDGDIELLLEKLGVTGKQATTLNTLLELKPSQKKELKAYMDKLDEQDHIQRMILRAKKIKEILTR